MMTKRRMIHDCLFASEDIAALTYRQRHLWTGLIATADDQGRGRAHPGLVRAAIFPFDVISQDEINDDLRAIAGNMLILYEVDGKAYYQIVNWWKYQNMQWASPSEYPPPDGWVDRFRYHGKGREIIKSDTWDDDITIPSRLPSRLPRPQEEEEEEEEEEGKEEEKDTGANAPSSASADLQAIIDVYSELFPEKRQHKATTKSLQSKLKTRRRDDEFNDRWKEALERAAKSNFIRGWGGFDLAWFLKNDDNWHKCYSGNYDDKPNGNGKPIQQAMAVEVAVTNEEFFQ